VVTKQSARTPAPSRAGAKATDRDQCGIDRFAEARCRTLDGGIRNHPFGQLARLPERRRTPAIDACTFARIFARQVVERARIGVTRRTRDDARRLLEDLLEGEPEPERVRRRANSANRSRDQF